MFPALNVPYSDLTLSCEINGEAANFCDTQRIVKPKKGIKFYSQETAVKASMAEVANKILKKRFNKIFKVKKSAVRMYNVEFLLKIDEFGKKR